MVFGKRGPRSHPSRSLRRTGLTPLAERLEDRQLLTAVDLFATPGNLANPAAGPGPFGVQSVGSQASVGAGWSVAVAGDVNGDGFQDYLIGAPTIASNAAIPTAGTGAAATYLIFGSNSVTSTTISNFLALPPANRAMALGQLGGINQTNPLTGSANFNFNGITFTTPTFNGSQLGYSVSAAGDVNGDGFADFLIGAPNIENPNNPLFGAAGAAFLVYGSPTWSTRSNKSVALDTPSSYSDQAIITFTTGQASARTGQSVAGIGAFLNDGGADIAIGAPGATLNGLQGGAVFVVANSFINLARTQVVDLLTVGQAGSGVGGVIFAGSSPQEAAGFAVAGGGNIDASSPATSDLLIGAPDSVNGFASGAVGPGQAYVVYGFSNLPSQAIAGSDGIAAIQLARVGATGANTDILGAVFVGDSTGDMTGYSVSTAGDFNGDNVIDFMIGSPGWNGNAGRMDLIYGVPSSPNPPGPIAGSFVISDLVAAGRPSSNSTVPTPDSSSASPSGRPDWSTPTTATTSSSGPQVSATERARPSSSPATPLSTVSSLWPTSRRPRPRPPSSAPVPPPAPPSWVPRSAAIPSSCHAPTPRSTPTASPTSSSGHPRPASPTRPSTRVPFT